MPLLIILSFDIILKITVNTDITAIMTETAKKLVSSNVYPKQALTNAPTGKSSVNANSKHSKNFITFFIVMPQSFPNISAYLFDKILDNTQNINVNRTLIPPRNKTPCITSKKPTKPASENNSTRFIS